MNGWETQSYPFFVFLSTTLGSTFRAVCEWLRNLSSNRKGSHTCIPSAIDRSACQLQNRSIHYIVARTPKPQRSYQVSITYSQEQQNYASNTKYVLHTCKNNQTSTMVELEGKMLKAFVSIYRLLIAGESNNSQHKEMNTNLRLNFAGFETLYTTD